MKRLKLQLDAGYIKRYHTFPIIGEQTVGQHSYGVAQFVRAITKDACSAGLLMAALDHDAAEQLVGDVPYTAKKRFEGMKEMVDKAERDVEEEYGMRYELLLSEKQILKLADLLEMGFFGLRQLQMGNTLAEGIVTTILKELRTKALGRYPEAERLTNLLYEEYYVSK